MLPLFRNISIPAFNQLSSNDLNISFKIIEIYFALKNVQRHCQYNDNTKNDIVQ